MLKESPKRRIAALAFLIGLVGFPSADPTWARKDAEDTESMIVYASKSDAALRQMGSSVSVLDGVSLDEQGFQFVADALRQVPGVQLARSGGPGQLSSIFLRGEESFRTLLLVDGLEMSDVSAPQTTANLAHLLVNQIDRIEIIRGPQGLLYGADAIGGVVSIVTRRGQDGVHPFASLEYGSFDTVNASAGLSGGVGPVDFNLTAQNLSTDGFSAKEGDPTLVDDDGYENRNILAVIGIDASDRFRLEGVVRYSDAEAEFDGFSFDPDRTLFTEEFGARVSGVLKSFSDRMKTTLALSRYQSNRADYDGGAPTKGFFGDLQSRFDGKRDKLELLSNFEATEWLGLLVGVDYETEFARTDSFSDRTATVGTYAEWQAAFADSLFLTGGVRFDHHEDFGDHVSYRATGAFVRELLPLGETRLHASLGTGFRAPSLNEQGRNATFGLPDLREEKSHAWDAGIEQSFLGGSGRLDVTYFDQRIDDEIRFDNVGFTGYFQSAGTSLSRGVETYLSLEPLDGLTFTASYTYTDATVNSPDAEDGLPRVRRPKHVGNFDVSYAFWNDGARLGAHLRTAAEVEDGFLNFRQKLDDYAVLDLSTSVRVVDGVKLHGRIENVLNERYQEIAGFATADTAAYVGLEGSF